MYQKQATQTCGPDEHERIVTAIESRDEVRAAAEMAHHLQHLYPALSLSTAPLPVSALREALPGVGSRRA